MPTYCAAPEHTPRCVVVVADRTPLSDSSSACPPKAALRTDATDPDGDIRIQLGPDGRLLSLAIDESVPGRLTHLALEEKLNDLLARANVVAQESWKANR